MLQTIKIICTSDLLAQSTRETAQTRVNSLVRLVAHNSFKKGEFMKYLFLLLTLLTTGAFASERESSISPCDRVVGRISAKYKELSEISSRMMVLSFKTVV